ncbi:unnamed protein product, partial [Nesidiocoris tenuis]
MRFSQFNTCVEWSTLAINASYRHLTITTVTDILKPDKEFVTETGKTIKVVKLEEPPKSLPDARRSSCRQTTSLPAEQSPESSNRHHSPGNAEKHKCVLRRKNDLHPAVVNQGVGEKSRRNRSDDKSPKKIKRTLSLPSGLNVPPRPKSANFSTLATGTITIKKKQPNPPPIQVPRDDDVFKKPIPVDKKTPKQPEPPCADGLDVRFDSKLSCTQPVDSAKNMDIQHKKDRGGFPTAKTDSPSKMKNTSSPLEENGGNSNSSSRLSELALEAPQLRLDDTSFSLSTAASTSVQSFGKYQPAVRPEDVSWVEVSSYGKNLSDLDVLFPDSEDAAPPAKPAPKQLKILGEVLEDPQGVVTLRKPLRHKFAEAGSRGNDLPPDLQGKSLDLASKPDCNLDVSSSEICRSLSASSFSSIKEGSYVVSRSETVDGGSSYRRFVKPFRGRQGNRSDHSSDSISEIVKVSRTLSRGSTVFSEEVSEMQNTLSVSTKTLKFNSSVLQNKIKNEIKKLDRVNESLDTFIESGKNAARTRDQFANLSQCEPSGPSNEPTSTDLVMVRRKSPLPLDDNLDTALVAAPPRMSIHSREPSASSLDVSMSSGNGVDVSKFTVDMIGSDGAQGLSREVHSPQTATANNSFAPSNAKRSDRQGVVERGTSPVPEMKETSEEPIKPSTTEIQAMPATVTRLKFVKMLKKVFVKFFCQLKRITRSLNFDFPTTFSQSESELQPKDYYSDSFEHSSVASETMVGSTASALLQGSPFFTKAMRMPMIKTPLSPRVTIVKRRHSSGSDESMLLSQNDTLSEPSDVDVRVSALEQQLRHRKSELAKLKREYQKNQKERLRSTERNLINQIQ